MWRSSARLWCLVAAVAAATVQHERTNTTPVAKVTELLKKLSVKVQEQGAAEAASYDKYACFCKEQSGAKAHQIEKSRLLIEGLQAAIDALTAEIAQLDGDVVTAKSKITTEEGEAQNTQTIRDTTFAAYQPTHANLTEGVTVITAAIEALEASRANVRSAQASLLAKKALAYADAAWLSSAGRETPAGKPNKYEYGSSEVLDTLRNLLRTFKQELARVGEEEAADAHEHNMIEGARLNRVKALQAEIDQKQQLSSQKSTEKAEKEGLKADEVTAHGADQAFLDELTASCEAKATAWDTRSKTRASEITKLTEAVGVLEGMGDLYSVNKKLVGLAQRAESPASGLRAAAVRRHAAPSLLQLAQTPKSVRPAAKLLEQRASALHSPVLAALAAKLAETPVDHFVEVRGLINDLIAKLEAEATAEATQKSFCDTEMSAAVTSRDERAADMETHQASIDLTSSEIVTLQQDIEALAEEIAELYRAKNEMTELRNNEKAMNEQTVIDADAGADAVRQAIALLQNFYGTTLLQKAAYTPPNSDRQGNTVGDLAPETFSGEYSGKVAESKGIIGLLQVIASDFERTSTTTAAAENQQASDFETQIGAVTQDIDSKEKDKGIFEQDLDTKKTALIGFEDNLRDATTLHGQALTVLEALKSSCVDAGESWEERRAHRQQEIAALKEALEILESWRS